jgi:uncharacterized protein
MDAGMNRREFLLKSATAAAGVAAGVALGSSWIAQAFAATSEPAKPKLPTRVLGRTGVNVTIVGLGGDGLISDSTDPDAVVEFLTAALDAGVNYFDTAHMYGKEGRCEKNLGLLMGTKRRKDVFLATKTGARTYDTAMVQMETSLKRLKVDRLDLVQVHHVKDKDDIRQFGAKDGVLKAIRKMQDQKVVRFVGMTGHPDSANVKKALEMYDWDTFMCFVNPAKFSRPALQEQLPVAKKKNIGVIAMKTFGGRPGSLVGQGKGQADSATLLRFALGQDVALAIPGVSTVRQLEENLKVAKNFKPLSEEETRRLIERIDAKSWKR